jgi:transaldolase
MTKIYLDSGDPAETKIIQDQIGFLDGQTTNPSLIVKNPEVQKCKTGEKKCTESDLLGFYKDIVTELRMQFTQGQSVSIEVYADANTTAEEMITQGTEMNTWIPNAHIKLPITSAGLQAAQYFVNQGVNVNMTLCFSVDQALAVHAATRGCTKGQVYVSPFIGRLDDIGESGVDLIENILNSFAGVNSNVEVLAASIRNKDHVVDTMALGCDLLTIPYKILSLYTKKEMQDLLSTETADRIPAEISDNKEWNEFDITRELTEKGLAKFAEDWRSIFTINTTQ